jgi:ElaB/YqjD/DUF883 family membrane-anchored ribosome-binding protein
VTQDRNDDDTAQRDATEAVEAMSDDEQAEVAEIRAEIEDTRIEMGGTLNELGDRLEPGRLVEQAKDNVREATIGRVEDAAKGATDMVMDTIKQNPIPAAMAAAGLALLWANRSQGNAGRESYRGTGYGYQSRPESSYTGSEQGGIGATARDSASTVGDAVGSVAEGAQQATGEVIGRAGETAQQVGWKLESFMQANPLAVGAIAMGAGALIGSLVPETAKEREVLGDASRQVGTIVRDTVDQAATKAEETLDEAQEKVGSPA